MTRDRARLLEVLDAIARVERHAAAGREAFFADDLVHDAVLYRIGSLGESVKDLSPPLKVRHPGVRCAEDPEAEAQARRPSA